jgi:hypothetical protein
MVRPMQQAYQKRDREEGIRIFLAYVLNNPHAWDEMSHHRAKRRCETPTSGMS